MFDIMQENFNIIDQKLAKYEQVTVKQAIETRVKIDNLSNVTDSFKKMHESQSKRFEKFDLDIELSFSKIEQMTHDLTTKLNNI